jgi:hypothetical protein
LSNMKPGDVRAMIAGKYATISNQGSLNSGS